MARPSNYSHDILAPVSEMARRGFRAVEIADALKIKRRTWENWIAAKPELQAALKIGYEEASDRVEMALFTKAIGYDVETEEIKVIDGKVVRIATKTHYPPDTGAIVFWLKNRRRDRWSNAPDLMPPTGIVDGPAMDRRELIRRMILMLMQAEEKALAAPEEKLD